MKAAKQRTRGDQISPAGPASGDLRADHNPSDDQYGCVGGEAAEIQGGDQGRPDAHKGSVASLDFSALVLACRMRRQYQQAELRLGNQLKAIMRSRKEANAEELDDQVSLEDHTAAVVESGDVADQQSLANQTHDVGDLSTVLLIADFKEFTVPFHLGKLRCEKTIRETVKDWPIAAWIEHSDRRGLGPIALGLILGETGDLSQYANPAKVWKRMGLAVFDGKPQRRVAGTTKAKKDEAIGQGFSPRRRALMHVIGDCLVKGNQDGPYRTLYVERKANELERLPGDEKGRLMHAHKRALRYMEKRLLKDLWLAWRQMAASKMLSNSILPDAATSASAA